MARQNLPSKKAGTSKAAALAARRMFAAAYVINGRNITQAALAAGRSVGHAHGANTWGYRVLQEPAVQKMIDDLLAQAAPVTGLTVEAVLKETARIALADPRQFFRADGSMVPMVEWTDDMKAAVASVETSTDIKQITTDGQTHTVTSERVAKLKFWNKNDALEKAFRHLGLYERDNRQKAENLTLQVLLVQPGQT